MRAGAHPLLLVDSGDLFFKRPTKPYSDSEIKMVTDKAHLILDSLNLMKYDALGIGDDDLLLGKEVLVELSKNSNFPFLSANLVDQESGKPLFPAYAIKEVNGLRIGLFSVLSPELFTGPADSRLKGLSLRSASDVANEVLKELQPKTDLVILLSHLGYSKDMELAQAVSGIHIIAGAHTGMNLASPPVIKNTLLLQTGAKGMYGARLDLTLLNNNSTPYNTTTKRALENNLNFLGARLSSGQGTEADKVQWRKAKEDTERKLRDMQGKNGFTNTLSPLVATIQEDPEILKRINEFKSKYPEPPAPAPPVK